MTAITTAEHAEHWVADWAHRHGVTLTPAAAGSLRDLLTHQAAELERGHHRFGELTAARDQARAALDRVRAECDALENGVDVFERTGQGHAVVVTRVAIDRIRAAIEEPTP